MALADQSWYIESAFGTKRPWVQIPPPRPCRNKSKRPAAWWPIVLKGLAPRGSTFSPVTVYQVFAEKVYTAFAEN